MFSFSSFYLRFNYIGLHLFFISLNLKHSNDITNNRPLTEYLTPISDNILVLLLRSKSMLKFSLTGGFSIGLQFKLILFNSKAAYVLLGHAVCRTYSSFYFFCESFRCCQIGSFFSSSQFLLSRYSVGLMIVRSRVRHTRRRGSVVRTSVCSWRTFPDLRLIHG